MMNLGELIYFGNSVNASLRKRYLFRKCNNLLPGGRGWRVVVRNYLDLMTDMMSYPNDRGPDKMINVFSCSVDLLAPASVAQLDAPSDWRPGGRGFNPRRGRQHSFVEIDHEIFSAVILSLPLIQEGQLSVSGERMCTILVNRLED